MADSTSRTYSPRNWRRLCDTCGILRDFEALTFHPQDGIYTCTYDAGERTKVELDKGNARQRPATIKPVPYPKPQNLYYPNTLETDDAAVFNFLARMVEAECGYEKINTGSSPLAIGTVGGLSWAARYFYDLIQEDDRDLLISDAETHLTSIATYLLSRQYGSASGPAPSETRGESARFGAVVDAGSTFIYTNDVAAAGLAMLYAYRVHGTGEYLQGARNAASYLRNVQSLGQVGTDPTTSDAAGTIPFYTGALSATALLDVNTSFYTDHVFYPSQLIVLEFWNELKTTDGDQNIGCTHDDIPGFASPGIPEQLLSQSITDLHDCWTTGITDSTGTLVNGLSATTPREFFNAYPASKSNFPAITGTGRWEFVDGNASVGTQITSQTFAMALSSLYNYGGATTQVTAISDWLRTFTSNSDFESDDDISTSELYQETTGEYDPTATLATVLTVRDSDDSYAAIKVNGSSVYDWGAFGLLCRIWASRNRSSFMTSRLYPLNTVQRFYNGNDTDTQTDRIATKGLSGLDMQTGFGTSLYGGVSVAFPATRLAQGSDLEIDTAFNVSSGELTTCGYWQITGVDDPGGLFPYGDLAIGAGIVLANESGSPVDFSHMATAIDGYLPFFLATAATTSLPDGYALEFVRTETAWKQACPPFPLSSNPLVMTNDAARSAQFGRSFREVRS